MVLPALNPSFHNVINFILNETHFEQQCVFFLGPTSRWRTFIRNSQNLEFFYLGFLEGVRYTRAAKRSGGNAFGLG